MYDEVQRLIDNVFCVYSEHPNYNKEKTQTNAETQETN